MGKVKFKPKSSLGKLAIGLIILMFILLLLAAYGLGELILICGACSGIAGFICGIIGIVRKKDYSVWVVLSTIIGFILLLILLKINLFPTWRIIDMT